MILAASRSHQASRALATSTPAVTASATPSAPAAPAGTARLVQVNNQEDVTAQAGDLRSLAGRKVSAEAMPVIAVPADEGFWIADSTSGRVWVQLDTHGGESKATVKSGDLVTFTATWSSTTADSHAASASTPPKVRPS